MSLQSWPGRVIETRSGRYAVAAVPLPYSDIPGFAATLVQAVRTDDPATAVRLTLYERVAPGGSGGDARAA